MLNILIIMLVCYMLALLAMGFLGKGGEENSIAEYFLAGQSLSPLTLTLTFVASWIGASSILTTSNLAYKDGISAYMVQGAPVLFSSFVIFLLAPKIRSLHAITQPEILQKRFGTSVSLVASVFIIIFMLTGAAAQLIGIGAFMSALLGLPYYIVVIASGLVVLLYLTIGGFKSVVITDVVQFFLIIISICLVAWAIYAAIGGFGGFYTRVAESGRFDLLDMSKNLEINLSYIVVFGLAWAVQANVWQRITACRSIKDARKMSALSFVLYIPIYVVVTLIGVFCAVWYTQMPSEGIFVSIAKTLLSPYLGAIVVLGLISAIMSTMDSMINIAAFILSSDIYLKLYKERQLSRARRLATIDIRRNANRLRRLLKRLSRIDALLLELGAEGIAHRQLEAMTRIERARMAMMADDIKERLSDEGLSSKAIAAIRVDEGYTGLASIKLSSLRPQTHLIQARRTMQRSRKEAQNKAIDAALERQRLSEASINFIAISQTSTILLSLATIAIALFIREILDVLWIGSDLLVLVVFIPLMFGIFFRQGGKRAALASMSVGAVFGILNTASYYLPDLLPLPWGARDITHIGIGMTLALLAYVATSLIYPYKSDVEI